MSTPQEPVPPIFPRNKYRDPAKLFPSCPPPAPSNTNQSGVEGDLPSPQLDLADPRSMVHSILLSEAESLEEALDTARGGKPHQEPILTPENLHTLMVMLRALYRKFSLARIKLEESNNELRFPIEVASDPRLTIHLRHAAVYREYLKAKFQLEYALGVEMSQETLESSREQGWTNAMIRLIREAGYMA